MTLYENLSHDELIGKTAKVVMSDGKWRIVIIEKAEYDEYKDRNIIIGNCIKTNDLDHTSLGGVWAYIDQVVELDGNETGWDVMEDEIFLVEEPTLEDLEN